jgi:hypothetical protein
MPLSYTAPVPVPKSPGYQRLLALGEERVLALNNLLARGENAVQVARVIQQQWGEFSDVKEDTLAQQLRRYRDAHIEPIAGDVPTQNAAPAYSRLAVTSHMIEMVIEQRKRILDMIEAERLSKKPSKMLKSEVESYMLMLKDVQKQQFDMGIDEFNGPALRSRSATAATINPDGSVSVMHGQVVEQTSRALDILDRHGVPADAGTH